MEHTIEVSRVKSGLYRVHCSKSGQCDMRVQATHIRHVRAMVDRAVARHEASPYIQGLRFSGRLAEGEFAGAHLWYELECERSRL